MLKYSFPGITVDYSPFLKLTNDTLHVEFPNSYTPRALANGNLLLPTCEFSPSCFGCNSNAIGLESLWGDFQRMGFLLHEISESLFVRDVNDIWRGNILSPSPSLLEIVILIDSMNSCKFVRGIDGRIKKVREELNGLVEKQTYFRDKKGKSRENQQDYSSYIRRTKHLLGTIIPMLTEFQICTAIKMSFQDIEFTNDEGKPDLVLPFLGRNIRIDAKHRLPQIDVTINTDASVEISQKTLLALLCKDSFPPISHAFDEQRADIVLVNITTTQYGALLSTRLSKQNNNFETTFNEALKMAVECKQPIILYSKSRGDMRDIFSIVLRRDIVEIVGQHVDKIDWIFRKHRNNLDFYELAKVINNLTKEDFT